VSPGEVAALLTKGQRDQALAAATEGVRSNPDDPGWRTVLGAVLIEMQRYSEGEKVLQGVPFPEALFNLAIALRAQGRVDEQVAALARIPAAWPGSPRAANELAQAGLRQLFSGRAESAAQAFRAQLMVNPGSRPAYYNLALAMNALNRPDEAASAVSQAIRAGHRDAELLGMLVNAKGMACDWDGLDAIVEELRRAARETGTRPVHPQTAQYLPQVSAQEQRQWAESYCRTIFAGLEPIARQDRRAAAKLRVGYISSDFRDHAVAWLLVGLVENHDRERFEVHAYSTGPRVAAPVRERIARAVHEFVDCSTVPGRVVAERIAADGIDVLVDLGGHTQGARLDILAHRPAPVQGHFLGYAGTTGAPFVDFFACSAAPCRAIPNARHLPPRGARTTDFATMPSCCAPSTRR
jgi:predicted O-linked N-acetylglucosamine transferase (SPINDLY family)